MKKILLQARQLQHFYADKLAVKDINIELKQGDILGLLGPNGAGKSTTMKMLCGVLPPHHGQIIINDFDLLEQPSKAKQQMGYLPEQPPLYSDLSVSEYLVYCCQLRRVQKSNIENAVQTAMQRCGLVDVKNKLISQLSKGFQQRVGIAQAIIHQPAVIILDEPTVGLDPIQIRQIRQLITELGEDHGVILSTHILPEVQAVCNQVKIIHQGELVYDNSVQGLNEQQKKPELLVRLQRPPVIEKLNEISFLEEIELATENQYILHIKESALDVDAAAEQFSIIAVENSWGLAEIRAHKQTLESIFVSLTSTDKKDKKEGVV